MISIISQHIVGNAFIFLLSIRFGWLFELTVWNMKQHSLTAKLYVTFCSLRLLYSIQFWFGVCLLLYSFNKHTKPDCTFGSRSIEKKRSNEIFFYYSMCSVHYSQAYAHPSAVCCVQYISNDNAKKPKELLIAKDKYAEWILYKELRCERCLYRAHIEWDTRTHPYNPYVVLRCFLLLFFRVLFVFCFFFTHAIAGAWNQYGLQHNNFQCSIHSHNVFIIAKNQRMWRNESIW